MSSLYLLLAGCGGISGSVPRETPTTPLITWASPGSMIYGVALSATQLNATAGVPGVFAYTPLLGTVLNAGPQTLSVTFTPTDTRDYTTATASVSLVVNPATPKLTWAPSGPIIYGTALSAAQLDATANVPGTFVYTPVLGALLDAGTQTLSVTFTPADSADYTAASGNASLVVHPAVPVLSWSPSGAIAVGMALGSAQLNAVAKAPGSVAVLPGSFVYSPGAGMSFTSSGTQTLQVTFTPTDTTDYTTAELSVTLTVQPFGVAAWGDSLTAGFEGTIDPGCYPCDLQTLITLPVVNEGVGGQTSTQIGVREGAIPTYATVSGGVIPGTGGVGVIFPAGYEPVTSGGPIGGISGTILGIHGIVTLNSGAYTFTPTSPGNPVSAPGTPRFVVDIPYASYLPVFWEGENNADQASQVVSDLAAQVATVPSDRDYLVMGVINQNSPVEWSRGALYTPIVTLNNELANSYGSHYLDIRKILVDSYNPSLITDVSDYNHDEPPTSLRAILGSGTLGSAIGPADTSFTVNLTDAVVTSGTILTIDTGSYAENVEVASVSGNTVTVVRDQGGTDTAHSSGVAVAETDPTHLNASGYQVVANAVAKYLAVYDTQAKRRAASAGCNAPGGKGSCQLR